MDLASPEAVPVNTRRAEVVRFAQVAHRALPGSGLTWVQCARAHQDLGVLIREVRNDNPRPALLQVLMQLVVDELAESELPPGTLDQLRDCTDGVE